MFERDNSHGFNQEISENQEQFAAVLNVLLPEIERQLMKDIERQLQSEFQQKYLKTIQQIDSQALQQYQQALLQLQESRHLLEEQKNAETQKEIHTLQTALATLQEDALLKMQEKFLEENFDERIMTHQSIIALEKEIQEEIFIALDEKHQATKQRQLKELIIAHETKQIKLRKQLDLQIKSRIYCSSGLEELKQEIKQSRTQMGSQKSEYNLKLKKIQAQIKEYQDKIKDIQKMGDVQKLREKYEELRVDLIEKQTERQLENDEKNRNKEDDEESVENDHRNDDSLDEEDQGQQDQNQYNYRNSQNGHQYSNSKTLKRQQRNSLLAPQFAHKQQNIHDEDDSQSQQFISSQNNRKKFDLAAYFKGYLLDSQTAKITESQNIHQVQDQKKTLLNLGNLSEILKQKVSMDPLERYLKKQSIAEQNDMNSQNSKYKTSNFAELYEQHLKNLNRGFGKKGSKNTSKNNSAGLSDMAKKTIIKNLALYHRNNFAHPSIHNKSSSADSGLNNAGTENFNSFESNLLRSSK